MRYGRKLASLLVFMVLGLGGCGGGCADDDSGQVSSSRRLSSSSNPNAQPPLDPPVLSCGSSTQTTINVTVTAGASGAPAGFSLHWGTSASLLTSSDWPCGASFSGVPSPATNRFHLASGASTSVEVGNLFDEELGVSFTCNEDLACGTEYSFRAFAHHDPDSGQGKSDFSQVLTCSTLACDAEPACTYTQGYWKNHGPVPSGNNLYAWPSAVQASGLVLGTVSYDALQLLEIFGQPAQGNGLIALAHQLMAARLNIANGADGSAIGAELALADALIGSLVVPPVGGDRLAPSATGALTAALAAYNEGATGPGHCE
jgi:hypothetical protein